MLGLVQGLTEFAPISSSGHLILVPWLFNWTFLLTNPSLNKTFDVALHMGTLIGAVLYFRRDIVVYVRAWGRSIAHRRVQTVEERLAWFLVIGTVPGVILGAALENVVEDSLGQPWVIAVMLAAFGIALYLVDRLAPQRRDMRDFRFRDALIIGVAQGVALQPGVSRSGVTITAARWLGIDRESAARFSFLLSLPIIAGAGVLKGIDLIRTGLPPGTASPFVWGMLASGISGFLTIWGLLAYLRRRDFAPFVIYRLILAAAILILIATGVRSATIG